MASESQTLAAIRGRAQCGAYREAAACVDALPLQMRARPAVALERARVRMRQGRMTEARAALTEVDQSAATVGELLVLAVEAASLRIYQDVAIRAALADAEAAFAVAADGAVDPADRADAERVHVRILLTAAIYYEVDAETGRQARDRLTGLADTLERAGRIDEALAAHFSYAERLDDPAARVEALAALVKRALVADRPGLAGELHVSRAEHLLETGAASDLIRADLESATALFAKAEHRHGPIDVERVRARLAVERELATLEPLEACLQAYRRIDFPRGALSVLLDLSQLAHERGDTPAAAVYRRQSLMLADEVGLGLMRENFQLAQADLLMRNNDYGAAIELCQAALAADPPTFSAAGYEQLLATAYAFIDDYEAARAHGRKALAGFESIGAAESASNATIKLAADLTFSRRDGDWDEAETLLSAQLTRDEQRGDFAMSVSNRELVAQIYLSRFFFSPTHGGEVALLDAAERTLAAGEELARCLPAREAARRIGSLHQLHGQLYQARGDMEGVERAWCRALAAYEPAGLAMEAANCRYIIGTLRLNRANQELMPHFGEAERNMRDSLTYYEHAGMRVQAADTRFLFARLYTNAAPRVGPDLRGQMLDAALGHLTAGEADYDAIRRDYAAGSVLEMQRGKRAFTGKSSRIYELGLEILTLHRPDPVEVWHWSQRAKARALGDAMGSGSVPPARLMATLEERPDSFALVTRERELAARINRAPPQERRPFRSQLAELREQMAQDPHLADYLELRTGAALGLDDLQAMLASEAGANSARVCVDWMAVGERLFLLVLRPGGTPQIKPLALTLGSLRAFVVNSLAPQSFRQTLRDMPELLRELEPLIAPLADLSEPEELLILSPTGPLHALPLHALEIDGEPLLVRNPVAYCPSLSVLRHCLARRHAIHQQRTAALFGDPSGDRAEAAMLVNDLAQRFGTVALTGGRVTRAAFEKAVAGSDLVHFQGHAVHDRREPLNSHLLLADGPLLARDVFSLRDLRAELVTLAACESAANVIETGDEPLGLIPALLYAGANAVLATLWRVHQASAAQVMRRFYNALAGPGETVNKAQALREAMLAVRATPGFGTPYHWAPFVLQGDWH